MTEKRFDEKAVAPLLGDCRLEDDHLYRWGMKGEAPGIYLGDIEEIERHFLPSEIMEMTGGLASRSCDSRFPLLAFPCTLAEFVAFEDRACVFRAHLEAGDETADLLREIAAENPDAGILACALMPGELPDDEEKLILLPLEQPAPAAPPEAVLMPPQAAPDDGTRPVQRQHAQEQAIMRLIREAGHDPLQLPMNEPGKPGIKSHVRNLVMRDPIFTGAKVFDKAWERLRSRKEIADQH